MSSSSTGRNRSNGATTGAAGKISPGPGKPLISAGKENARSSSRVRGSTQKPTIKPMVGIDKNAVEADPRARKSTSSVPRGRSSSPSEFNRVLTDLRRNSNSNPRFPVGALQKKKASGDDLGEKSSDRCDLGKRVIGGFEKGGVKALGVCNSGGGARKEGILGPGSGSGSGKRLDSERRAGRTSSESDVESVGSGKVKIRIVDCEVDEKRETLNAVSRKRSDLGDTCEKSDEGFGSKDNAFDAGSGSRESKVVNKGKISERENSGSKYQSKLHEKLAFLEGKVKRIASDIKRTKEMLDMNNPDASKTMLSDIQEKISGIEKAMGRVVRDDANAETGLVKNDPIEVKEDDKKVLNATSSVKGLNAEDLEARLFPHHKLIRDRTLSKAASGNAESHAPKVEESKGTLNVVEKKAGSMDDNTITMEFLASLSEETAKNGVESSDIQAADGASNLEAESSSMQAMKAKTDINAFLMADETLDEFDDQENVPVISFEEEVEENLTFQLNDIGGKSSTGGWFVSEGESVLLTYDDGSCSLYDIANCEEKAVYKPPSGISPNMWRDCWTIRAPGPDGCSRKYVIAASAGNSLYTGFCSWDYYTKEICAFHVEDEMSNARPALAPLSNNTMHRRNNASEFGTHQWWYKPCGPLVVSTASCQKMVHIYDIRDGDQVMSWELQKPVSAMDFASPLQWRNRGKVVIAESDAVSLWDVSSLDSQALITVSSHGRNISALHVNNTEAEIGGGIRQRVSSSEAEGNDGVFCTSDSINLLDFRVPSGIGLKIPKVGVHMQSAFSRGDSIYVGCSTLRSTVKKQSSSHIQHLSIRQQKLVSSYALPETNAHYNFTAITQVWGDSNLVMGVCGLGLFVFDSLAENGGMSQTVKECVGPDDMYSPSFDYASSRVLIVSRDRPACWKYLF